jgi:hypothetical protein
MQNWPSRCERIAGTAGSGSYNHTVGPVGGQFRTIDSGFYVNQANRHTVQHHIIQGMKTPVCDLGFEHSSFLDPAFTREQIG